MVEEVIDYLALQPSATTSPIYLAVNTAAMLTFQGGPDAVAVYVGDAAEYEMPYVRVFAGPERAPGVQFLGGVNKAFTSLETLMCECVAEAGSYLKANRRADALGRAVEAAIQDALSGHTITALSDLGGTSSLDRVSMFQIVPPGVNPDTQVTGKAATGTDNSRADVRLVRVNLTVFSKRSA